jgi:hypothetical protein
MLHDVASGMLYLHARRYVHGNLRSPNLLLANDKVGKSPVSSFAADELRSAQGHAATFSL